MGAIKETKAKKELKKDINELIEMIESKFDRGHQKNIELLKSNPVSINDWQKVLDSKTMYGISHNEGDLNDLNISCAKFLEKWDSTLNKQNK